MTAWFKRADSLATYHDLCWLQTVQQIYDKSSKSRAASPIGVDRTRKQFFFSGYEAQASLYLLLQGRSISSDSHIVRILNDIWWAFFEILSDLNQAAPNHLADESQRR